MDVFKAIVQTPIVFTKARATKPHEQERASNVARMSGWCGCGPTISPGIHSHLSLEFRQQHIFNEALTSTNQYACGFNRPTSLSSHLGCIYTLCIMTPLSCGSCWPPMLETSLFPCQPNCINTHSVWYDFFFPQAWERLSNTALQNFLVIILFSELDCQTLTPNSPIPYFPQPFLGVAIQWSHTHTGRSKRQTADRRRYYSTWPWANYTTDTSDTPYCVAFKKYFNS